MAQKRTINHIRDDLYESERDMFSCFQDVANDLSHFYAQSVNHQKLAFQAGEKYAFVKLHKWMFEKLQDGRMVTVTQILTYLQGELNKNVSDVGPSGQNGESEVATTSLSGEASQNQDMQIDGN